MARVFCYLCVSILAVGVLSTVLAGPNAGFKVAVHVQEHSAKQACASMPIFEDCSDIQTTYAGANVDAFPVFFNLTEYLGLEFGLSWPDWTQSAAWTSCSDLAIGEILLPGDGVSQAWTSCQTGAAIAGWVWLYADGPGRVCVVPHPMREDILVLDCSQGLDVAIQSFCCGVYGGIGDEPCTATPECEVFPASLDFGTVTVGQFAELTFTLGNPGSVALRGEVSETCDHYEISSGGGPYTLGAGDTLAVTVRFAPQSPGTKECEIETGLLCASVWCTGEGDAPSECLVSPIRLGFNVLVGDSMSRGFRIGNIGGGVLEGEVTEECGEFTILSGGGTFALGGGEEMQVTIQFRPDSAGVKECIVATGTACADVTCTGTADDPPECTITPDSLDFGDVDIGEDADLNFKIENTGGYLLEGEISEDCAEFSLVDTPAEFRLRAGERHRVTVRFSPTSHGVKECRIGTNCDVCGDVPVRGVGESDPECIVTPNHLNFGNVAIGREQVLAFTLANAGGRVLQGWVSDWGCNAFNLLSEDSVYALARGESAVYGVRFAPASLGMKQCYIVFNNTSDSCDSVLCDGTGVAETVPVSVDIRPGVCPNQLKLNTPFLILVSILGQGAFDVHDVEVSTIRLRREGVSGEVAPVGWSYGDVGTPFVGELCDCHELAGDGFEDLSVTFRCEDIGALFDPYPPSGSILPLQVCGSLSGERALQGADCAMVISGIWRNEEDGAQLGMISYGIGAAEKWFVFSFFTKVQDRVKFEIFDVQGRIVETLLDEPRAPGIYEVTWDGMSDGRRIPAGVYFARVRHSTASDTKKFVVVH